ncbi:MAG: hypothetical protein HQ481_14005 [Alphaproteobacteria bacterium]|nr:hypothetical protein [Alphaproteobacteria bacterium]
MSLYNSDRRYRQRFWGGLIRLVVFVGLVVTAAVVSYQYGIEDLESQVRGYQQEVHGLESRQGRLEQENANLLVEVERAKLAVEEWERRYTVDVPSGDRRAMLDLLSERLEAGIDPERLAFLIQSAENLRDCEPVETKRFLIKTPIYEGANTSVSFAREAVAVTGTGQSETTAEGLPQAWYDPRMPVTITLTRIDGETREVTGVLPLQQSIVHEGVEHHFLLRPGARGFVQVAAERCAYP